MSRVFVLGAGSSKAVINAAPLNDQLLPQALSLKNDPRITEIADFVNSFYRQDAVPPLEDILTQVDICIAENRPISTEYDLARLGKLREDLVYAICRVLEETLERGGSIRLMKQFIDCLAPDDTIISLSYDLIVDNSILWANMIPNYAFPVRYFIEVHGPYWSPSPPDFGGNSGQGRDKGVELLKLHGSLDWLYCPACRAIDVTLGMKGAAYIFRENEIAFCHDCGMRYDPYIVTPTFLKNYGGLYLSQIWQQAEEKLSRASEVVFIGYSMPDADIILRTMLARAMYRNRQFKLHNDNAPLPPPGVTVVDYNDLEMNPTRSRYEKLFGSINYFRYGFRRYVNEEMR